MAKSPAGRSGGSGSRGARKPQNSPYGRRELIVVAKPEAGLKARGAAVASLTGADVSPLGDLLKKAGATMAPVCGISEDRVREMTAGVAATPAEGVPDLATFYHVDARDDRLDQLCEELAQQDLVAAAYVKPPGQPPVGPAVLDAPTKAEVTLNEMTPSADEPPATTPDYRSRQGYLDAAPAGVDAAHAWAQPGGKGQGVKIIDLEWGWNLGHEDLLQMQTGLLGGTNSSNDDHGTAVLGEVGGDVNGFGVTGICPEATVSTVAFTFATTAAAIVHAAKKLSAGDIMLLEIHRPGPKATGSGQFGFIAIEWWPDDFAAIRFAVDKGIIVVEPAGNGFQDLDDAVYDTPLGFFGSGWKNPFRLTNPQSGAIVVGAGNPPSGTHGRTQHPTSNEVYQDRARCGFSNHGARVDCQGWGWEVTSTGYGDLQGGAKDQWYTDAFSGTSSASPIVVGVLGCVQGARKAKGDPLLTPGAAQQLLRSTGSPQQDAPGRPKTQRIGNRPDLKQLLPAGPSKAWMQNQTLQYVYATTDSQNAWAYVQNVGWRRLKPGAPDAVTNMLAAVTEALAGSRPVDLYGDTQFIERVLVR